MRSEKARTISAITRSLLIEDAKNLDDKKYLDQAPKAVVLEKIDKYEEAIELWVVCGGD